MLSPIKTLMLFITLEQNEHGSYDVLLPSYLSSAHSVSGTVHYSGCNVFISFELCMDLFYLLFDDIPFLHTLFSSMWCDSLKVGVIVEDLKCLMFSLT
jgi:hypothetical protein